VNPIGSKPQSQNACFPIRLPDLVAASRVFVPSQMGRGGWASTSSVATLFGPLLANEGYGNVLEGVAKLREVLGICFSSLLKLVPDSKALEWPQSKKSTRGLLSPAPLPRASFRSSQDRPDGDLLSHSSPC